jgi:hypothetical protein
MKSLIRSLNAKYLLSLHPKDQREKGQTIVEFVLLLSVILSVSFGIVWFFNKNLARYWEYSANLVVTDKPGEKVIQLP